MLMENEIREVAKDCGIKMVGCTGPEPQESWLKILQERKAKGYSTSFERTKPEKRIDYRDAYPETQGVIVIGVPYGIKTPKRASSNNLGKIASVAWGRDYHQVVLEKMIALAERLKAQNSGFEYRAYVDNSRLLDRASAWRAGLGFFGKNNLLIHPKYGSFFFIGQLLINQCITLEKKEPLKSQCDTCGLCLSACPNGALHKGYTLDANRCVSYLTQKKKLEKEEAKLLGSTYLYGCDDCQRACPFNKEALAQEPRETTEAGGVFPSLNEIEEMTDEIFEKRFGQTAAAWRGKEILIRNAEILKNNRKNHAKDNI